jgi:hypothetical protein
MQSGRMSRLGNFAQSFQGEVNETNDKDKGYISEIPSDGPLILRGSNVCLYVPRAASQGIPFYLRVRNYLEGKGIDSKAFHCRESRVGFQRSSPQNNFRRIIACVIDQESHCFDTISYIPESKSHIPLQLIMGLLNTNLLDWYFRLGSTNSKVNEYQFNNLPCPIFKQSESNEDKKLTQASTTAVKNNDFDAAFKVIQPGIKEPPFSLAVRDTVILLVNHIIEAERLRGEISRSERSALCPQSQPYQNLIDRLFYAMAGLTDDEAKGLEDRLSKML